MAYTQVQIHFKYIQNHCVVCALQFPVFLPPRSANFSVTTWCPGDCRTIFWGGSHSFCSKDLEKVLPLRNPRSLLMRDGRDSFNHQLICLKKKHLIENPSRYENTVKHIEIHSNLRTCRIHFNRRLKQTSLLYYGQYVVERSRSPCLWLVQMGLGMLGPKHRLFENHQVNAVASHRA